ncbi:MAG: ABC-2 family transporter protein [Candidatus Micrarchaeia archaeon]
MDAKHYISSIARDMRIFALMQRYMWKEVLVYRTSALFLLFAVSLGPLINFTFITIIYTVSSGISGWSYYQLLLLGGVSSTAISIMYYFVQPWGLTNLMKEGGLDIYLTRPYSPYLTVLALGNPYSLSGAGTGIIIIIYSMVHLGMTFLQITEFIVMLALGLAVLVTFMVIFSLGVYKLMRSANWTHSLINIFNEFASYPLTIYGVLGVFVLSFVIPVGIATYYPVAILSGKLGTPTLAGMAAISIVFIYIFKRLFYRELEDYTSAHG